eukprot:scaffold9152_cov67-Phaeocystis_antarctica.AAC.3
MKSTKLVNTCEGSIGWRIGERASHVEHTHSGIYGCGTVAAQLLPQLLLRPCYTATTQLAHQLLGQRDHLVPIVAVLVVAPEEPNRARERGGLVVLDGSAAAVQKERVQQRHGKWPQHDEADCKGNYRLVRAGPSALNVERCCQVGLCLAREVIEAEALALKAEEERARDRR